MKVDSLILVSILGSIGFSNVAFSARPVKVAICHFSDEDGTFKLKSIPPQALNAHIAHGDVLAPAAGETADASLEDGTVITLDSQCQELALAEGA